MRSLVLLSRGDWGELSGQLPGVWLPDAAEEKARAIVARPNERVKTVTEATGRICGISARIAIRTLGSKTIETSIKASVALTIAPAVHDS